MINQVFELENKNTVGDGIFMRASIPARREDVTQNVQPLTVGILRKLPSLN